jgi:Icc-related predicted phosphoesterase
MPIFGRGGPKAARTRIFFATDIHGSERCFRKWLNAASVYGVQALVLGGDITGKALVPLVAMPDGWHGELHGKPAHATDEAQLEALRQQIRNMGFYDVVVSPSEKAELDQPGKLKIAFAAAIRQSMQRWVELADERLGGQGIRVAWMLGNDDEPDVADVMRGSSVICFSEDGLVDLPGGFEMVSIGFSTPTPWHTPREISDEELGTRLEEAVSRLADPAQAIFNVHCPPANTHLDQAPKLDSELRPVVDATGMAVISVGSQAVREVIMRSQPLLGLHGHVHESPGAEKLGRTLCINPGSDYRQGMLRGAIVDLQAGRGVSNWQLVQG